MTHCMKSTAGCHRRPKIMGGRSRDSCSCTCRACAGLPVPWPPKMPVAPTPGLLVLPWTEGDGAYDDQGPAELVEVQLGLAVRREGDGGEPYVEELDVRVLVWPTDERGLHTGRRRHGVRCLTCEAQLALTEATVHPATTSPRAVLERHLREAHGWR